MRGTYSGPCLLHISGLSTALCWIIKSLNVPGCQPSDLNRAQNTYTYIEELKSMRALVVT